MSSFDQAAHLMNFGVVNYLKTQDLDLNCEDFNFESDGSIVACNDDLLAVECIREGVFDIRCINKNGIVRVLKCYARGGFDINVKIEPAESILNKISDTIIVSARTANLTFEPFDLKSYREDPNLQIVSYDIYVPYLDSATWHFESNSMDRNNIYKIAKNGGIIWMHNIKCRTPSGYIAKLAWNGWIRFV